MRGLEDLAKYRLAGVPIDVVELDFLPGCKPGTKRMAGSVVAVLAMEKKDSPARADLRMVRGLPVAIHCDDWRKAWPFAEVAIEHEPSELTLCSPDVVMHWNAKQGLRTWEL